MIKLTDNQIRVLACLTKQYRWWSTAELTKATGISDNQLYTVMSTLLSRGHAVRQRPTGLKWQFCLAPDIAKSLGYEQKQLGIPHTSHLSGQ